MLAYLQALIEADLEGLNKAKATSALKILSSLGIDFPMGQVVKVPGDRASWIVFGEWEDGSLDLIRESSSGLKKEILWGWKRGQSLKEYKALLAQEKDEESLEVIDGGRSISASPSPKSPTSPPRSRGRRSIGARKKRP